MEPLISAQELANRLPASDLIIIDCRFQLQQPQWGRQQYCQNHIPTAHYLDLNQDLSAPPTVRDGRHPLPDIQQLTRTFRQLGIQQNQTPVVIYDQHAPMFAARLWWLLQYWGHDCVQVLDGGWQAWQAAGYPTATGHSLSAHEQKPLTAHPQSTWVIDQSVLEQQLETGFLTLVDCRDADRYAGLREPIDPIAGHIPGAINRPWRDACTPEGFLRSPQEIRQQWADLDLTQPTAVYCGSGVTACVNLLALAVAHLPQPQLYPGGWSAWCRQLP